VRLEQAVRRAASVAKAAIVSFYHDQGTHHAGALTYYALMSLFPLVLLAVALLGLIGDYPGTYNAIIRHLRPVVPAKVLTPINDALRTALKSRHSALAAFGIGVVTAFYGSTGYLEATRRALNVVFEAHRGRSFLRRKLTDIGSTAVLLVLVLVTVVLMFAREHVVRGLVGSDFASVWRIARWPLALITAMFVFSFVYFVTPDTKHRTFRLITPGAAVGVAIWLLVSAGFSEFLARVVNFNATYGSFAAAVVLIVWLWLTNVALFLGAEVNAELEHRRAPDQAAAAGPQSGYSS
jgi:membrane protein